MKMSTLITKTSEQRAAEMDEKVQNGYQTVLNILQKDIQGAEILPGAILSLNVATVVGDEFAKAVKDTGSDVIRVGSVRIWRSTTSRGIITVEGLILSDIDDAWDSVLDEIRDRA